jgi:Dolichyl-phosphate-mannose-protein mannosyltransferase
MASNPRGRKLPVNKLQRDAGPKTSGRERRGSASILVAAGLLLLYVAQCAWFIGTQSLTYDEPVHIAEGLDAWRNGRFEQYNDHPPLARLLCSLPLLDRKWQVQVEPLPESFQIPRISPDPVSLAWRARSMNVVLGVLLGLLLWIESKRQFSVTGANFALALFAFSPSLITHFSLATTDGAATLLIFATAIQIWRWQRDSSWRNVLFTGVILGFLLLAKFSTLPMFVLALGLLLVMVAGRIRIRPWKWNWRKTSCALFVALFVLWAGYFFHISHLTIRDHVLTVTHPNWTSILVKPTRDNFNISIPVPAGEYIAGFRDLVFHNAHGHRAFFLGQVSPTGGWKLYYPVAILLKWPLIVLLATALGLFVCARRDVPVQQGFWMLFPFPVLYFTLAIFAHFNIGERHVLPLYPFALLLAAAAGEYWWKARWWGAVLVCGIALLNATDALRYAPGYLSYMNIVVNPNTSYQLLSDSNVDWGQGLLALRKYQDHHPGETTYLAYFGSVDPNIYGIKAQPLGENEHVTGILVVGATQLSGQYLRDPGAYRWLLHYKLRTVLDHCMYVFVVDH